MKNVEELIRSGKANIVDVRTPGEFNSGHVKGSINIPLQEVVARIEELRKMNNLVLCCASGGRSGQAANYLQQQGIDCVNAGSWLSINSLVK